MSSEQKGWIVMQTKTFTNWVNSKLAQAGYPKITNLFTDLEDGVVLAHLLSALGKGPVPCNKKATAKIVKMENVSYVLECIKNLGITLVNIGSSDIVDGNETLVLGLIWTIISRMELSETLSGDMYNMREELLSWVKKVTKSYKNVSVTNFTTSWQDGLAFNAVIHHFRPELIEYESLKESNAISNLNNAFTVAEDKLGISRLLDAEDVAKAEYLDEKSIFTYVSQYYQKFKSEQRKMKLTETARNFVSSLKESLRMRHEYEEKAGAFLKDRDEFLERIGELSSLFNTIAETVADFEKINDDLICRSVELVAMLQGIQETAKAAGIKLYTPPGGMGVDDVDAMYFDTSSFDIKKLESILTKFSGSEAQKITATKDSSRELLERRTGGGDDLVASLEHAAGKLEKGFCLKEPVANRIHDILSFQAKLLRGLTASNFSQKQLLITATKLFKVSDIKSAGVITRVSMKKIIKALDLDCEWEIMDLPSDISLEKLLQVVRELSMSRSNSQQIRAALQEFSDGKKLSLAELGISLEELPDCDGDKVNLNTVEEYVL